jgi:hypothetical protein
MKNLKKITEAFRISNSTLNAVLFSYLVLLAVTTVNIYEQQKGDSSKSVSITLNK